VRSAVLRTLGMWALQEWCSVPERLCFLERLTGIAERIYVKDASMPVRVNASWCLGNVAVALEALADEW
jgi:hypothetical protein